MVFEFDESKRIQDDIFDELEKYRAQEIKHPLIAVICPDIINPPLESEDDFLTILYHQENSMTVIGAYRCMNPTVNYKGLYFDYGEQISLLCGVGWWCSKSKNIDFFQNPNVTETVKMPQGHFFNYLKIRR